MNQSVVKALKLLDFFLDGQTELTLSEITEKSGMPKPTVFRFLSSLEACGMLMKSRNTGHDVRYRLGLKLLQLGNVVAEQLEIRTVAKPWMQALCEELNEDVHLVILDGDEAVYIEKIESNQKVRLHTRVGKRSSVYIGSGPKLLLAFLPAEQQNGLISRIKLEDNADSLIQSEEALYKHIEQIKAQGYSISLGEQERETIGISYPIRDHSKNVIAALSVSGPVSRIDGHVQDEIQVKTREAALNISKALGCME
ncbi:helix-turn-helix domain-containing protein [Bacillus aerolatus]|uniref:Helix-turn-helix domain-containing protein n=1 Tax=Bacillus aerolatus TaxID=2653354 RepID=A0A6I1FEW6_9BACI|nr:IclR family transcriptional regulator [Bacillus aerolatus]KAB7706547.1 helix-turn-helix domain-containing protein [Bacillus aerolatus]